MDIYQEITGLKEDISFIKGILVDITKLLETTITVSSALSDKKKYLTAKEAAVYLELSDRTFSRYKTSFPVIKKAGRFVYKVEDLDDHLAQRRTDVNQKVNFLKKVGT
ncbi:MAG: helix-turn-helix domain-containing protein [Rickettsiales bacterium]|jgi:hypothetical protein|nr:helix-turn-helix domain-containing protein [Rickettsiales bacterium]